MAGTQLSAILAAVRRDLKDLRTLMKKSGPLKRDMPIKDLKKAINRAGRISLIGEIKFASPSAGLIRPRQDPAGLAVDLERAGAAALSILTEPHFFLGDPESLNDVSRAVTIPVLRKDFILDELQIEDSYLRGADAVLLIAGILGLERLRELIACCRSWGLSALVEVHNRQELEIALKGGAQIIGINNRDLKTFKVTLSKTLELAGHVPPAKVLVSESGIRNGEDIANLRSVGVNAVLVGTSIMRNEDPAARARDIALAGGTPRDPA
jgi:indole-3-glycerol phosphate synthase